MYQLTTKIMHVFCMHQDAKAQSRPSNRSSKRGLCLHVVTIMLDQKN
jgi:hypothetical protein